MSASEPKMAGEQDDTSEFDAKVMKQQEDIKEDIRNQQPLVSSKLPISTLRKEFEDNDRFKPAVEDICGRYSHIRTVRRDGNCFFRGFTFAYLETLLAGTHVDAEKERARVLGVVSDSKAFLMQNGYEEVVIDSFWESFMDQLHSLPSKSSADLEHDFSDNGEMAEYLLWYTRLLTAGYIKANADEFLPFIDGLCPGKTVNDFCSSEVEPMGQECEQVQIIALTKFLGVGVRIECLDGNCTEHNRVQSYVCPEDVPPRVTLLYRPGHYDILYN